MRSLLTTAAAAAVLASLAAAAPQNTPPPPPPPPGIPPPYFPPPSAPPAPNGQPPALATNTTSSTAAAATATPAPQCLSYGIDFQNGGKYFINSLSNDNFTAVNQFTGCQPNTNASVWFVPPSGDEIDCSTMPTTPDNANQLTTCPIKKSDLTSGEYKILVFGNNAAGLPYAWERTFTLDVGPQVTTTITPTSTVTNSATAYSTVTSTSSDTFTYTASPSTTYTVASTTAPFEVLIIPSPQYVTTTQTITWSRTAWTHSASIATATVTASCTIPPLFWPDVPATWIPRRLDAPDSYVPGAAPMRATQKMPVAELGKQAPDEPTVTSTAAAVMVTTTTTVTTVTNTASQVLALAVTTTLPPSTVTSGTSTYTSTVPTPTWTMVSFEYSKYWVTSTVSVTWTMTQTTTPIAVFTSCALAGGHFGGRW